MTEQEINRAVQYVTAATSYDRAIVEGIVRTGLQELVSLTTSETLSCGRDSLLEYVCRWTITRTGQDEPLVREVLGCAGRWLDEVYDEMVKRHPEPVRPSGEEGSGLTQV
ncbi:MAG: hypothetical protein AB7G48_05855 [Nitrospiraceae bacterium]